MSEYIKILDELIKLENATSNYEKNKISKEAYRRFLKKQIDKFKDEFIYDLSQYKKIINNENKVLKHIILKIKNNLPLNEKEKTIVFKILKIRVSH